MQGTAGNLCGAKARRQKGGRATWNCSPEGSACGWEKPREAEGAVCAVCAKGTASCLPARRFAASADAAEEQAVGVEPFVWLPGLTEAVAEAAEAGSTSALAWL